MSLIGGDTSDSGVDSITGEGVDNADPKNPVITKTPTSAAIFVTNNNEDVTTVTGNTELFVNAKVSNLTPPAPVYSGDFEVSVGGELSILHTGNETDYKIEISGTVTSVNPDFLDTFIVVKVISDLQGEFTGGVKPYPVGVSFSGSAEVGFGLTVYGRFPQNEVIRVQLSSSTAGNLILSDCIFFAEKIQPLN